RGPLLKNQLMTWDPRLVRRRVSIGKRGGQYLLKDEGSLEFSIGVKSLQAHIVYRLQDAAAWLLRFNQSVGQKISVGGFLRCTFDNPGFRTGDNARMFEIHPVRAVEIGGE